MNVFRFNEGYWSGTLKRRAYWIIVIASLVVGFVLTAGLTFALSTPDEEAEPEYFLQSTCGDGRCDDTERRTGSCPADCKATPDQGDDGGGEGACDNDGVCEPDAGEASWNCGDCPSVCGDDICSAEEVDTCLEDCPPEVTCGDGICSAFETVETCPTDCIAVNPDLPNPPDTCGNGQLDTGEACDGNILINCLSTQTCSNSCQCIYEVTPLPTCGDGNLDPGEECDGSVMINCLSSQSCSNTCQCVFEVTALPLCGNGRLDGDEECDGDVLINCFSSQACSDTCQCVFEVMAPTITPTHWTGSGPPPPTPLPPAQLFLFGGLGLAGLVVGIGFFVFRYRARKATPDSPHPPEPGIPDD